MTEFSIIIETENLGMAGLEDLKATLDSLKNQTLSVTKAKEVILIVGSHVTKSIQKEISKSYPWIKLHLEPNGLDYARSKMLGAEIAKGEIVLFMDSDMRYERTWLENMVHSFPLCMDNYVLSGDTRLKNDSSYNMALNSMWMVQILDGNIKKPTKTTFFPLNNFAIAKKTMLKVPLPYEIKLYRNKIPLWEDMLIKSGFKVTRIPGTRGHHAPPSTLIDWFLRMLIYGSDFVALADFSVTKEILVAEQINLLGRLKKFVILFPWKVEQLLLNSFKLIKEDTKNIIYLPGSLFIGMASILVITFGGLIAMFNRDYVFNTINAHESKHTV